MATGSKALEAIKRRTPILILLDLILPGISRVDLCRILKDSPTNRDIPIIMLPAKSESSDLRSALGNDYLPAVTVDTVD